MQKYSVSLLTNTYMQKWPVIRETYQTEPRTYVLFMSELDNECKIILKNCY